MKFRLIFTVGWNQKYLNSYFVGNYDFEIYVHS